MFSFLLDKLEVESVIAKYQVVVPFYIPTTNIL